MEPQSLVSEARIDAAQQVLGFDLPQDYRDFLLTQNGREWWTDSGEFVQLYPLDILLELSETIATDGGLRTTHPGLVVIGGDGSREVLAYDTRRARPPLVLVDLTSNGWHEALFQANSLTEFLRDVEIRGWDFQTAYEVG
ncbi:SMI1/KNR4 family protein [Isoptericola croceus]|uniref:SMI1/KNR4 family protein n=1 Tax=Isoptericola croceus TaxID=3031406 RepID=UPI0023F8E66A|nr:SMI1/KNR4 family protein [Isoptericola croceus]